MNLKNLLALVFLLQIQGCAWMDFLGVFGSSEDKVDPVEARLAHEKAQPIKKRIWVLNFINKSPFGGTALGEFAAQHIREYLTKYEDFTTTGEKEISIGRTSDAEEPPLKELYEKARNHGVAAIIWGTIENVTAHDQGEEIGVFRARSYTLTAATHFRLLDVSTEKELVSKLSQAEGTEEYMRFLSSEGDSTYHDELGKIAVGKALDLSLVEFAIQSKRIAWSGRIFRVEGGRYYINSGEGSGIKKGQLLKIFEEGKAVYDNSTGLFMGNSLGKFKGVLRIVDFLSSEASIAVTHFGQGFKENDRVELYNPTQN